MVNQTMSGLRWLFILTSFAMVLAGIGFFVYKATRPITPPAVDNKANELGQLSLPYTEVLDLKMRQAQDAPLT